MVGSGPVDRAEINTYYKQLKPTEVNCLGHHIISSNLFDLNAVQNDKVVVTVRRI